MVLFLSNLEIPVVTTALVGISDELGGFRKASWVSTSYLLGYAGGIIQESVPNHTIDFSCRLYHHLCQNERYIWKEIYASHNNTHVCRLFGCLWSGIINGPAVSIVV